MQIITTMCQRINNQPQLAIVKIIKSLNPLRYGFAKVDKCLKPLLKELRQKGIQTLFSCCGHDAKNDIPYLIFVHKSNIDQVLASVLKHKPEWKNRYIYFIDGNLDDYANLIQMIVFRIPIDKWNVKLFKQYSPQK